MQQTSRQRHAHSFIPFMVHVSHVKKGLTDVVHLFQSIYISIDDHHEDS